MISEIRFLQHTVFLSQCTSTVSVVEMEKTTFTETEFQFSVKIVFAITFAVGRLLPNVHSVDSANPLYDIIADLVRRTLITPQFVHTNTDGNTGPVVVVLDDILAGPVGLGSEAAASGHLGSTIGVDVGTIVVGVQVDIVVNFCALVMVVCNGHNQGKKASRCRSYEF